MGLVRESSLTFSVERTAYLKLCEGVNTPRSLACHLLASSGEWDQLLKLPVHFNDQNMTMSAHDYLVTSVLKKCPRLPLGVDTAQVALDKFLECEQHVKQTNIRLGTLSQGLRDKTIPDDISRTLRKARGIIKGILGPLSQRDLRGVWESTRFGPGSTSAVSGTDVSAARKYSTLGATPRLAQFLKTLMPSLWHEGAGTMYVPIVWQSRVITVPKNARTDRPISIEPHLNGWMQLGIGRLLRKKLKRVGLDLDVQADVNRLLASLAQEWELATIDLESASDTIAEMLVRLLLPVRWVHLLELCRSEYAEMPDGTTVRLEKWSSMGNGYTFELESLIFYALALACTDLPVHTAVFGDDIIVPQHNADSLLTALNYCGFRVNSAKTFLAGTFFESCGTDWLGGKDIRPFYFKTEVNTAEDLIDAKIKTANQIRLYAHKSADLGGSHGCDGRFLPAWLCIRSTIPRKWLDCRIPNGFGEDRGLISNFDEAAPTYSKRWGEYRFKTRRRLAVTQPVQSLHGYLLSHLNRPPRVFVSRFLRDRRHQWSIGDYECTEPILSITMKSDGVLKFRTEDRCVDLRGCVGKGQLAVGRVQTWPSLGSWL